MKTTIKVYKKVIAVSRTITVIEDEKQRKAVSYLTGKDNLEPRHLRGLLDLGFTISDDGIKRF